mgnify:CR=1 FL=1
MPNFLNPSSFVLTLDSQTYSGAEFTIQTMMLPDITADPTTISSLPFDITTTDVEYLTAIASFSYSYYEFI